MDILIKGMEMPKEGNVYLIIGEDGVVSEKIGSMYHVTTEAIELPPHGRLVDIDRMIAESRRKNLPFKIESTDDLADFLETYADLDKTDHTVVVEASK